MLKLYKRVPGKKTKYWEAWTHEGNLIIHKGTIGEMGTTTTRVMESSKAEAFIQKRGAAEREKGYEEVEPMFEIIIEREIDGFGSESDLELRHQIQDIMDECLGWTGNGHCDGGDIGSGTMAVYCLVVDQKAGLKTAFEMLRDEDVLDEFSIFSRRIASDDGLPVDEDRQVYWPDKRTKFGLIQ